MPCKRELVLILLTALLLRLAPIALHGMPLSYDQPFHERMASTIQEKNSFQKFDSQFNGRPNIYPPLYSTFLAATGFLSGLSVRSISTVLPPLYSTLTILSIFVLVRRVRNEKWAVAAAFLYAVSTASIVAAFDSPENILLFSIPALLLVLLMQGRLLGSIAYASGWLWNYFTMLVSIAPIFYSQRSEKKTLLFLALGCLAAGIIALAAFAENAFESQNLYTGISYVSSNLKNQLPVFSVLGILLAVPILAGIEWKRKNPVQEFFGGMLLIGTVSLALGFFFPGARPWEHFKFMAFSGIILLAVVEKKNFKRIAVVLAVLFLILSTLLSSQVLFPRITKEELNALEFLEGIEAENPGMILADPSVSEHINVRTSLKDKTINSLYFESEGEKGMLGKSLKFLETQGRENGEEFTGESALRYVFLNFEDQATRGVEGFEADKRFNKIYSLNFEEGCLFPFIGKRIAYLCGENETQILELNEFN